ncbi:MAG: glycosyltransferase [Chloroflexi bacterium]|nr:glycosyltransferase [Chloroflexota bacterium]
MSGFFTTPLANMPQVTVIIPTHNSHGLVTGAIDSVLRQTFADLELIVVDDGSTDNTGELIAAIHDPRLRTIYQRNRERSAARNTGLAAAQGAYVAFLDDDDFFLPEKLELQMQALAQDATAGAVYSDVLLCDSQGHRLKIAATAMGTEGHPTGDIFEALTRKNFLTIGAALVRRTCLPPAIRFDESLSAFEDWDFWLRVAQENRFAYRPGPVAGYRMHSAMTSRNRQKMWRGALAVRQKLHTMARFPSLSPAARQYSHYQLGLLHCLAGDMGQGRRNLIQAFSGKPRIPLAALVWGFSFFGRLPVQKIVELQARRHEWLAIP